MEISVAFPEDIERIVEFQQKMAQETEQISLDNYTVSLGVQAVFSNPAKGTYVVAKDRNTLVASMLLTPEWSDWRNATFLWIQSLYVLPEYRKKGIFRKMYDYVKKTVNDSNHYAGIKLYVASENELAQEVYKNVGMISSHYRLFEWNKLEIKK
ncbi:MAG: GNAT family N-acetyltransferase [Bacteroidales bacterium]